MGFFLGRLSTITLHLPWVTTFLFTTSGLFRCKALLFSHSSNNKFAFCVSFCLLRETPRHAKKLSSTFTGCMWLPEALHGWPDNGFPLVYSKIAVFGWVIGLNSVVYEGEMA